MKKTVRFVVLLLVILSLFTPLSVSAESYAVDGTDMTVELDDTLWYVFTRNNLDGNPELDELELERDAFYTNMVEQDMYMDAIAFWLNGWDWLECLVMKYGDSDFVNMSNYSDEAVLKKGKFMFRSYTADGNSSVYENQYKFFRIEYEDEDIQIVQYLTAVNGEFYSIQFQSPYKFTEQKYELIKEIMDNIRFDVDTSMKEKNLFQKILSSLIDERIVYLAVVAVVAAPVIIIITVVKKRAVKKNEFTEL